MTYISPGVCVLFLATELNLSAPVCVQKARHFFFLFLFIITSLFLFARYISHLFATRDITLRIFALRVYEIDGLIELRSDAIGGARVKTTNHRYFGIENIF